MAIGTLNMLLLGSTDPERAQGWYRRVFQAGEGPAGSLDCGGGYLFIETHSEIDGPAQEPARIILNFAVEDCHAVAAAMEDAGTTWIRKPEEAHIGIVATGTDPDGNYVQILQFATA